MVIGRKNYYQVLMVDQSADADIMAVVHRRLAQRYHPDMDPGEDARQRMLEINQAYDVLRNPDRRAALRPGARRAPRPAQQRPVRQATDRPGPHRAPGASAVSATERLWRGRPAAPGRGTRLGARLRTLQGLVAGPDRGPRPGLPGVAGAVARRPPVPGGDRGAAQAPLSASGGASDRTAISRRACPGAWRCSRGCPGRGRG